MSAPAAVLSCGRRAAIAVCSVLTALCVVRQCKLKTPLAVAPHDYCRNIPRLAGKHVEQLISVLASSRGNACQFACSDPGSRSHLVRGSPLDGHSVYPKRQTSRPHALPLHRAFYLAMIVPVLGLGVISSGIYEWIALGAVIVGGSLLIWWGTERAWGKFT